MTIHELHTYLRVDRAAEAIAFYERAFSAREKYRLTEPSGRIGHAELEFGPHVLMLADEYPELGIRGPRSIGGTTLSISLRVDNADAMIAQAIAAGAAVVRPVENQFFGLRSGTVRDPFGHEWVIGQQIEEVSPEEMQRRYDAEMAKSGG